MRRIFELLKQDRQHIKKLNDRTRKNVITAEATVTSQYGKSFKICEVNLEPCTKYLLMCFVYASISGQSVVASTLNCTGTYNLKLQNNGSGTMLAGGGVTTWGYVETDDTDSHVARLYTYGYVNATYNQTGKMVAIPIETAISGGGYSYIALLLFVISLKERGVIYER